MTLAFGAYRSRLGIAFSTTAHLLSIEFVSGTLYEKSGLLERLRFVDAPCGALSVCVYPWRVAVSRAFRSQALSILAGFSSNLACSLSLPSQSLASQTSAVITPSWEVL
jgi:hypothetical protein